MIDIQPQHLPFGKLLAGRLFRIPQYQRAYSWHRKQRQDLFDDIERLQRRNNDATHFMATIVALRRERRRILTDDHWVVDVVDGQQRLTTLIILLKAIEETLDRNDPEEERIRRDIDETLVKPDHASLLLLQTNHDSSDLFANYLRTGKHPAPSTATTLADRELLLAVHECKSFVDRWLVNDWTLPELVSLLKNRITLILHEISDESIVYTVFEVLNSRGLDVSWFDRLKSMLMAIVFESDTGNRQELIDEVHQLWADIYRCVGLRLGMSTESLRFAATLKLGSAPSRTLGEADAAEVLHDRARAGPGEVIAITTWLKEVTQAADQFAGDRRRNAVTRIAQARLAATSIYLREDLSNEEKRAVLRRWENVSFRIYGMLGKDARTRVGDYVRLSWRIANERLSAKAILDALASIGQQFPVGKAVDNLRKADCYTDWQEELRYMFYRYEEHLAREAGQDFDNEQWSRIWESSASDSIEHIRPQSEGPDDVVHRLGNLLVLPPKLNSKLGAKSPKEKRKHYLGTGLLIAREVVDDLNHWNKAAIDRRERAILEWGLKEWAD